ncbi:MAG TPA: Ppx/GppA phosphatase family protein [Solirubrobacterales bacterium]|nr:Ppx/GppA phosphatase family protein [Solirubrobacterales bacterium]
MSEVSSRVAVIDVGTNSTRLLVADVEGGRVEEVDRHTRVTKLGRGVDLTGMLSSEAVGAVCETVAEYVERYEQLDAEGVRVIATSAVRDAENGAAFIAELRERFDLTAEVLDGDEEARLTYRGATSERAPAQPTLVVDIGGGSTEVVVGCNCSVDFHTSMQAGGVRHTERHVSSDPPAAAELEALAADIRGLIDEGVPEEREAVAQHGIAVAGTPTSLAAIDLELDSYDSERVHGHRVTLGSIQTMLSQLASRPLEQRAETVGLHPDRAPTIVAGTVILIEVMRAFGLEEIEVSERDILHGAALDLARGPGPVDSSTRV